MTVLQALSSYYDRMAARGDAELPGFSREKISFAVVIDAAGAVVDVTDLRDTTGRKPVAVLRDVPASFKRPGIGVSPFFLWDKTSYALGAAIVPDKRTPLQHQAFRDLHIGLLADSSDEGLTAFRKFLEKWTPDRFAEAPFSADMLDTNIVFRLAGDAGPDGRPRFIHDRPAALPLIEARGVAGDSIHCLVSGTDAPIARLHPAIKGVDGAQTMGAALVSFNLDAFSSYGREQGANAPTGQAAAFRYGAALNRLLDRGSGSRVQLVASQHLDPARRRSREVRHRHRFRLGDTTTVFWADTADVGEELAAAAEAMLASMFETVDRVDQDQDSAYAAQVREMLESLAEGRSAAFGELSIPPGVRIHVLGLAPNAARLSVRFWLTETLGHLATHVAAHAGDCRVEPAPLGWGAGPSINLLLLKTTAPQEKWDNIPPLLAGEMARAVLGGGRYPRTLLSTAIMRLRAGDDPATGWHAAAIRAVLARDHRLGMTKEGAPMSLDKQETNPAYRLGRLFAVLEAAQYNALGRVNATIRDRYFGAASATPASVFPLLLRGAQNHLASLRKEGKSGGLERDLEEVVGGLATELPRSLRLEEQGRFAIGYYHQRAARFAKKDVVDEQGNDDAN
ncbi:type I-C CRISPR-associated protein Cas8c/Csd1 [Sphingomonas sp.]|uniref:type I-C CRISPR-associated protein Cas8c/Csd1 n=1 Tax=Sphingomonas sp. TaxID=28214 RepID=UPI0035BC3235